MNYAKGLDYIYDIPTFSNVTRGIIGDDLALTVAGSADRITVEGRFADSFAQLASINFDNSADIISNAQIQIVTKEKTYNPNNNPLLTCQYNVGIADFNGFIDNNKNVPTHNVRSKLFIAKGIRRPITKHARVLGRIFRELYTCLTQHNMWGRVSAHWERRHDPAV